MRRPVRLLSLVTAGVVIGSLTAVASAAPSPDRHTPPKSPLAVGYGGAVASVDPEASAIGVEVLRRGGNAVDAAVATAAALGVTEPYSGGVGGGGYFVYYDADTQRVQTIDGRERAPLSAGRDLFLEDGAPLPFPDAVTSGLSIGTPGVPATWEAALDAWGRTSLREALDPAAKLAERGFVVDETFRQQTAGNEERFRDFPASAELFLPGGKLPEVGSVMRNPDLARTYREFGRNGMKALYGGEVGRDLVDTVRKPPLDPASDRVARPGDMRLTDLREYAVKFQRPTTVKYRGLDVYGMAPSSSGGTTVGQALNMLEKFDMGDASDADALHRYLEAARIAFADRGRWVGDPAHEDVPTRGLLSQEFADARSCLISDEKALTSPVAPGDPSDPEKCDEGTGAAPTPYEGPNTTHLTTADRWGNVVAYTLSIEQTGGSGITVPGRGFLLNNELTDFSFAPANPRVPDPNLPGPGKRPRSSMSPTIVLEDGRPVMAVGSPGGSTIITTVLQILVNTIDRGMPLNEALQAPRASQRNGAKTEIEPSFEGGALAEDLAARGHDLAVVKELGASAGVQWLGKGRWAAVAEEWRRGGGSARVVHPVRH